MSEFASCTALAILSAETDYVIEVIKLFHPDSKIREAFSILSNENRQDSEVV